MINPIAAIRFSSRPFVLPRSKIVASLGLHLNDRGAILSDESGQTNVEGVWTAGDVRPVARQIAVAVGTGNWAALAIHRKLSQ